MIEHERENGHWVSITGAWNGMVWHSNHRYGVLINVHYQLGSLRGESSKWNLPTRYIGITKHSIA